MQVTNVPLTLLGAALASLFVAPSTSAQTVATCDQDYMLTGAITIDSLSTVASKFYGNAMAYRAIVMQTNVKSETDVTYAAIRLTLTNVLTDRRKLCIPSKDTARTLNGENALPGLDGTSLRNATYGSVTLKDGKFSESWSVPPLSGVNETGVTEQFAWGDLNRVRSAAVITYSSGGGSGFFYNLSVMQVHNGTPTEVAKIEIGDRSPVLAVAIQDNQVMVDYVTQGSGEGFCCGTLRVVDTYKLNGDDLTPTAHKELGSLK